MDIFKLILFATLLILTAFFVASEFAIVKIRSTKIDQLVAEGNQSAILAKKIVSNLDEYLSACQLGITITALGIGWLGEPTVHAMLHPLFLQLNIGEPSAGIISFVIAFGIITFLHVVVGELAPKTVAIQKAEFVTLLLARPLIWFYRIMYPFIWLLNGSARILVRMFGLKPISEHEIAHSEEELRLILSESYKSGEINQSEFKYVSKIFDFDERIAKEIMVPRTEMITISIEDPLEENLAILTSEKFTRYPVVNGDKDHIIGLINVKELLTEIVSKGTNHVIDLNDYVRPVIPVIESIPIQSLLIEMQKQQIHMAILYDEYGGTAGLITVEDIIEEIVGEIRDEFDVEETPLIKTIGEDHYLIDGKALIHDITKLLLIEFEDVDADTIGGWMLSEKYNVTQNEKIIYEGFVFVAKEFDGHQLKRIEVFKYEEDELLEELAVEST